MSNPYDPSQQNQQWGQSPYPGGPDQGYAGGTAQGQQGQGQWGAEPQQWGPPPAQSQGQWGGQPQQPAGPAQIDWHSAPPQPGQSPWQGPDPYAAPAPSQPESSQPAPAQGDPWVAAGTAQTAQEVADQWQTSQPAAPAAEHQQPAPEAYQPPTSQPQPYQPPAPEAPAPQAYQPPAPEAPVQEPAPQQWPSYDAPGQQPSINEAATVTTPAVPDPAPAQEEPEALTIGRGRDNSIVLDDMLVSRKHVRITADTDGLVLEDLGSRNGTYVNGRRVERTHLSEGDRIGIGAATFEVRDGWLLNV